MPLQNRVLPDSSIVADSQYRGMFMGNRGCLHNDHREWVKQRIALSRWICCALEFKGRKRELMKPGNYTELFFLDEVTALAAGHRPCAECRRAAFGSFVTSWAAGNPELRGDQNVTASLIDANLDKERRLADTHLINVESLVEFPKGLILKAKTSRTEFLLWWNNQLFRWSVTGYSEVPVTNFTQMKLCTPVSVVQALRNGYEPIVHESIRNLQ